MASILEKAQRPLVMFDPANKEHREHYVNYMRDRTWGKCPVRFGFQDEAQNASLAFTMRRKLVEYYLAKEFKVDMEEIADHV
jgi:hypothetical protein